MLAETDRPLTVGAVAELVGISVRTLHHWDAIGLVHPSTRSTVGYRSYTDTDVGRIHRVLVYRELGFSLSAIGRLLDDPHTNELEQLREQHHLLQEQITRLQRTAQAVHDLLRHKELGTTLSAQAQAEIFGREWREDWAHEARERWGDSEAWRAFEARASRFTPEQRDVVRQLGDDIYKRIAASKRAGARPDGPEGIALAERHREMIGQLYTCSPSMHALLGRMYVDDDRFSNTLDAIEPGLSLWLREAIYAAARSHGIDPDSAVWE